MNIIVKKYCSILLVILLVLSSSSAFAAKKRKKCAKHRPPIQTSLVVDERTGRVLHSSNANRKIYPASLTKVMTTYLIFESLASGKLNLKQKFYVSKYATKALPSKLYLKAGEKISVKDAILALNVKSANDVARVVGENIAGSERKFARLMTVRARQLGMKHTTFTNASGWHDPKQVTTAVDLAKLSIAIKRDLPQYYHFLGQTSFSYKGKTIRGHNAVLANYQGATGGKTGYHTPAGCNLITSATRGNKSLVGIVTGRKSSAIRDKKMVQLLDKHFAMNNNKAKFSNRRKQNNTVKVASSNKN